MCRVHQHEARALGLGKSGRREHAHTHTVTYQITCGNRSKGPCKEFYLRKPACYVGNPRESFFFSPGLPAFPPNQFFVSGDRLSQEPARRFVFHFIAALLLQSANFLKGEESFSDSFNFQHWLWRWELLDTFSGPFTDPFLSGINGLFLHIRCTPQQTSQ